jgi:hypothetical protein
MSVLDQPLSFPNPLAVYFESGEYIVHNWKGNTWAVFTPQEYSAFSKMRSQGMTPRNAMAAMSQQHNLGAPEAKRVVGRVLMLLWMRSLAAPPGSDAPPASPDAMRLTRTVPKAVYFVVTNRCNLACTYCYAESSPTASTEGDLSTEEALKVIDQVADLGVRRLTFTGGEALTRRDIFDLLTRARERGLRCFLITNGGPVTREKAERLAALAAEHERMIARLTAFTSRGHPSTLVGASLRPKLGGAHGERWRRILFADGAVVCHMCDRSTFVLLPTGELLIQPPPAVCAPHFKTWVRVHVTGERDYCSTQTNGRFVPLKPLQVWCTLCVFGCWTVGCVPWF